MNILSLFRRRPVSYDPAKILFNGAWMIKGRDVKDHHFFDKHLAAEIVELLTDKNILTVLDLGCGDGKYVKYLKRKGFIVDGVDGNPFTVDITNGLCRIADITKPLAATRAFGYVLSLEVGEHIPFHLSLKYLDNVCKHATKGVILSWAVLGQAGYGHINCQSNEWVETEMGRRGFERAMGSEERLRDAAKIKWFKDTLMVYTRI